VAWNPRCKQLFWGLRAGMVFFDLSANIGMFTLLAARIVSESGEVFSFEPDQENAA
jgi:predicted methyltransferase